MGFVIKLHVILSISIQTFDVTVLNNFSLLDQDKAIVQLVAVLGVTRKEKKQDAKIIGVLVF